MSDTWGHLTPDTPFAAVFPDGRVPLRSIVPIVPREAGAPLCYLVDVAALSGEQIAQLAALLWEQWRPECESVEMAADYIRSEGLPLRTSHFSTVGTTRRDLVMPSGDDDFGDWEEWDGEEAGRDEWQDAIDNCYSRDWGRTCGAAGSEECEFECPIRRDARRSERNVKRET